MASQDQTTEKDSKGRFLRLLEKYDYAVTFITFGILLFVGVFTRVVTVEAEHPFKAAAASSCISLASALLIASYLQKKRDKGLWKAIHESIADYISNRVKNEVIPEIHKIKDIKAAILPSAIYWSKEDKLLDDQINRFSNAAIIKFMSISAVNLLNKTIPEIPQGRVGTIELLLLNPDNHDRIDLRWKQLKDHDNEITHATLQGEIIASIYQAHRLSLSKPYINICIRFHDEIPFSRIEIADNILYLSFYQSQKNKERPSNSI